jgi:PAS domain S-box-containing protein
MHKLLARQLVKATGEEGLDLDKFIALIDGAYQDHDSDRERTDRAVGLIIEENDQLQQELQATIKKLAVQNDRFESALGNMTHGLCMVDRDNRLVVANQRLRDLFGLPETKAEVGVHFWSILAHLTRNGIVDRTTRRKIVREWVDALRQGDASSRSFELSDGRTIEASVRLSEDEGWVAVYVDVTDRRRLMEELHEHRHHLKGLVDEQTKELAEKTKQLEAALEAEKSLNELQRSFVSMASHEFRTPLAIIDGAARRLTRRAADLTPNDVTALSDKVHHAVTRMTRLIESTLAAARSDAGAIVVEPADCDLSAILTACCERQQELSANHDIQLDLKDLPATVYADPTALDQIFTNLLSNATKYSPDAPLVEVRAWRREQDVMIAVQDHGLGMDEDDLGKLFQRFFRAKTSTGIAGTGIGLNLIKSLVERHGGEMTVASKLGEGSVFTVKLPIDCRGNTVTEAERPAGISSAQNAATAA